MKQIPSWGEKNAHPAAQQTQSIYPLELWRIIFHLVNDSHYSRSIDKKISKYDIKEWLANLRRIFSRYYKKHSHWMEICKWRLPFCHLNCSYSQRPNIRLHHCSWPNNIRSGRKHQMDKTWQKRRNTNTDHLTTAQQNQAKHNPKTKIHISYIYISFLLEKRDCEGKHEKDKESSPQLQKIWSKYDWTPHNYIYI